ncbi:MAG: hypothetical protein ACM3YO_06455 [Bacteroidota bacterium]
MSRKFSSKQPMAPTGRPSLRRHMGQRVDWLFPDIPHAENAAPVHHGVVICPSCHAIYEDKHFKYDEERYQQLAKNPDVLQAVCEGCGRVEKEMFEGHLKLRSPLILTHGDEIRNRIYHEEDRARMVNPIARVGLIHQEGDTMEVWTTTGWLAHRIGREIEKAFKGKLRVQKLPRITFTRVMWYRED